MSTIAIIGAGNVGATTAFVLSIKNLASDIVLIDVNEDKEAGEVMDMADALSCMKTGHIRRGDFRDAKHADIVIITAGSAQRSEDTRLSLLKKNKVILASIFSSIGQIKKDAVVIIVSNPVDVLTMLAIEMAKLPPGRVFGTGTALDTTRLKTAVAGALRVSPQSVDGYVLGEHGDSSFVAWSSVSIGGVSAATLLNARQKKTIEAGVRKQASAIIEKKGATYYGIAAVVSDIVEAIVFDQKKIISVSTRVERWNGISGVCMGVPAVIGKAGVEKLWPLRLDATEKKKFQASARVLRRMR